MTAREHGQVLAQLQAAQADVATLTDRLERLLVLNTAFSEALTPEQVAAVIIDQGVDALSASAGVVALLTLDGTALTIIRHRGYPEQMVASWQQFPLHAAVPLADAVRRRTPIWVSSPAQFATQYPNLLSSHAIIGYSAWATLPLLVRGRVIGALGLSFAEERTFSAAEQTFALALAQQCTQAIERARLYQAAQEESAERARTAAVLQEREARLRVLVEQMPGLLWTTDRALCFTSFAGGSLVALGVEPAHIVGQPLIAFTPPDAPLWVPIDAHQRALDGESAAYSITWKDRTFQVHVEPLRDGSGQIQGTIGVALDITERLHLEAQLQHNQKIESVGRLVGGIAHDFNNLLTVISGYQDLVLTALSAEDPLREELEQAQHATQRAARLTGQLLAFARKQIIAPQIINLNDLVFSVDQLLRRLLGTHIELITLPASDALFVHVDPHQIEQVLINLAVNARDAMPMGGTLTITTESVDAPIAREEPEWRGGVELVRLLVRDTGSGMTEEVLAHLFEPFFTTKPKGQGTGLGLATCYGIIMQHDGTIEIESAPNQGTTVRISFPRARAPVTVPAPLPILDAPPHGTETVLLVEDEGAVRSFARRILEAQGYTVLEATNGLEALHVAQEHGLERIDLVLTDVVMPQLGGVALVEQLHAQRPDLKVLFMSGYAEDGAAQFGQMIQEAAFLPKPFTSAALVQRVWDVLERA
jgi:two-component system, cell cycle sensor histidine kinase and response regulator CckA